MQAVILAAGYGTRAQPLSLTSPKCLFRIANKPVLEWNLESIDGVVDRIIIVANSASVGKIENAMSKSKLEYTLIIEDRPKGTAASLARAKGLVDGKFLVLMADDIYCKRDIQRLCVHDLAVLISASSKGEFECVETSSDRLVALGERKPGLVATGAYCLDEDIFKEAGKAELPAAINALAKKRQISIVYSAGYWLPINWPWDMLDANAYLLSALEASSIKGEIEQGVSIKGKIALGHGSLIKSGTRIEGNAVIGRDCVIGPNCYIRGPVAIGDGSKIGFGVEIKNCIIGSNANIAHLSYIGDSIIADFANIGAGTIVANLRHDGKNVLSQFEGRLIDTGRQKFGTVIGEGAKLGIGTKIYPGRKIWPGMQTRPGELVQRDVSF